MQKTLLNKTEFFIFLYLCLLKQTFYNSLFINILNNLAIFCNF